MREYFRSDKKKREEAKRKKKEEKRNKRLNKKEENSPEPQTAPLSPAPLSDASSQIQIEAN